MILSIKKKMNFNKKKSINFLETGPLSKNIEYLMSLFAKSKNTPFPAIIP